MPIAMPISISVQISVRAASADVRDVRPNLRSRPIFLCPQDKDTHVRINKDKTRKLLRMQTESPAKSCRGRGGGERGDKRRHPCRGRP